MVNKRGWLRVVEASIAVLLVIGAILTVSNSQTNRENKELEDQLAFAITNIAENVSARESILNYSLSELDNNPNNLQIMAKLNSSIYSQFRGIRPNILLKICPANEPCVINYNTLGEVFSQEVIISTTPHSSAFSPKKLRVIAW